MHAYEYYHYFGHGLCLADKGAASTRNHHVAAVQLLAEPIQALQSMCLLLPAPSAFNHRPDVIPKTAIYAGANAGHRVKITASKPMLKVSSVAWDVAI